MVVPVEAVVLPLTIVLVETVVAPLTVADSVQAFTSKMTPWGD